MLTASQEADMSAAAYRNVVVVALCLTALTVAELGAKLLETQTSVASDLGPGWQCHKLAHIQICDRA
jgi:hypothetical protein